MIDRYIAERRSRGEFAPLTGRVKRQHLMGFAASFGARPLSQLGPRAIERWLESVAHLAPNTRRAQLSTIRCFARWCVLNSASTGIVRDWTVSAPKIPRVRRVPRDLTMQHFDQLLAACQSDRMRLLVWLMYGCGLRCIEIHRLDVEDFDPLTDELHVRGKGSHERIVPVPLPARVALEKYLASTGHHSGPLVRRADGEPGRLGAGSISARVQELFWASGVKARPRDGRSAHGLRAAAASDLFDETGDGRVVQEFLGHADMTTLHIYMRRQQRSKIRAANDRRFEPGGSDRIA